MKNKRLYYVIMPIVMAFTLLLSLFAPLVPTTLSSAAEIQATGLSASDAIVKENGKEVTGDTYISKSYTVNYNWSIPDNVNVKNGDIITFTIPNNVKIVKNQSFTIKNTNGNEVGTAEITAGSSTGTIKITNANNINQFGRNGTLTIAAKGTKTDSYDSGWMINKQSADWLTTSDKLGWQILYNPDAQKINNAIITDNLQKVTNKATNQLEYGQTYVEGSVKVYEGTVDKSNNNKFTQTSDITNQVNIKIDNKAGTLTIDLGNISTAIYITYQTKPNSNFKGTLQNEAEDNNGNKDSQNQDWQIASGDINSYTGSVSLKKVISTNPDKTLSGAVFEIIDKNDNDKIVKQDLTTDENGEIKVNNLKDGKYAFKETIAPKGYELNEKEFLFELSKSNDHTVKEEIIVPDTPTKTTSLTVNKVWNDSNNQDGKRPNSVTVKLLANGKDTGKTVELSSSNHWMDAFNNLDKKDDNGNEIKYTVEEVKVAGYTTQIDEVKDNQVTITNTHTPTTPPTSETTSLTVNKVWNDNNNAAGLRPSEVQVQLYQQNADGQETPVANINPITLNSGNSWSYNFTNLPKYDTNNKEITYTVKETTDLANYTSTVDTSQACKATITNTFVQPTKETTSLTVNKTWDDSNNQDNTRPTSVTVKLLANGKDTGKSVELSNSNNWTATFTDLDKKDDSGNDIKYTVAEVKVAGYITQIGEVKDNQVTITNTHTPTTPPTKDTTSLTVNKIWNDDNNKNGKRPTSITVHLLADGTDTGKTITLSEENNWTASFNKLAVNKDGKKITYTVKENSVANYVSTIDTVKDDKVEITNTYQPDKPVTPTTELKVNKVWNDNNNQAGLRPNEVQVQLYANDKKRGNPITLNLGNNWSYDFTNLPEKDANGKAIVYTVKEVNTTKDYVSTIDNSQKGQATITNTYTPPTTPTEDKTNFTVNKIWNDEDNKDGKRPDTVQVQLYANGQKSGEPITLSSANSWAYTFSNLAKTDKNGKEIKYTAKEINVANGYNSTVDIENSKATITNTYTPVVPNEPTTPEKPNTPSTPVQPSETNLPTKPASPYLTNTPVKSTNTKTKATSTASNLINQLLPQTGSSFNNILIYIGLLIIATIIIFSGIKVIRKNK